ncbi:MAG: 3-phosphoglycerate dehydrogenase [Phycisphaerales bacterium]|nr:3-phosphoglycerate dehydrogenase [Phycisphaerales bacterium]
MSSPLVIQTEDLDPLPRAWLAERCEVVTCPYTEAERLQGLLPRADALVVRTYTKVDTAMLARAPRLKVVGRAGVGLDNIDVPACRARGVEVVHTPGANTRAVVEYVLALILDALRPRLFLDKPVPAAEWNRLRKELVGSRQLSDLTLGILGFGRIGSAVARVAAALEMKVIYNDLREIPEGERSGARAVGPGKLFETADILTVHIDDRAANRAFVNESLLARMKPDVVFINAARGFVLDAAAAAEFFRRSPGALGLIDVHDPTEPFDASYPLLNLPNVHLAPHLASGTETAKRNMSWVVRDVWRVLNGERAEFPAPR